MQNYGFEIGVLSLPERNAATLATPTMWAQMLHICSYVWSQWQASQPVFLAILANVNIIKETGKHKHCVCFGFFGFLNSQNMYMYIYIFIFLELLFCQPCSLSSMKH